MATCNGSCVGSCAQCESCCALRKELARLREASELRARQDHDQCVAMFQQMQELVRLNEAMARGCKRREADQPQSTSARSEVEALDRPDVEVEEKSCAVERELEQASQAQSLQAIVVQQQKELETLRRRQRDATANGRVRSRAGSCVGNQVEAREGQVVSLLRVISDEASASDETDSDGDEHRDEARSDFRPAAKKRASQLRKLPLTSLRAQLKGKDLQLLHCQQLIAKLEARLGQLLDRKQSMAQSYQQTSRTQQAHLKKYLAYIRQQTTEKKALERQVRDLKQYVDVLEKKVVSSTLVGNRKGREITSAILHNAS
ncbi:hypothetical protein PHYSODRAFT_301139 [Phytophthora sojae]|uniref:Uncharacterized protein n=1 Tax=Phytophthora sojae (strain P6497) TaxID=1094619 RepID=G4ZF63_PHYSP|nr:hypothetical protein PHYSODRAFT_301139 [Phytophthora sojae]EGZ18494.1 hypothetical protein PHYSODRAFT_301139 [Phytophthora sojae]|eukprot:XP_009527552.1 hypothetical protein PHYSODRAFT_301139 [Phytophthora sojae]